MQAPRKRKSKTPTISVSESREPAQQDDSNKRQRTNENDKASEESTHRANTSVPPANSTESSPANDVTKETVIGDDEDSVDSGLTRTSTDNS